MKVLQEVFEATFLYPVTTADPAVYILSGTVLIEATTHKRALVLFGNITQLAPESIEKQVAYMQLSNKMHKCKSWFLAIREICFKYEFDTFLYRHFKSDGHSPSKILIQPVEKNLYMIQIHQLDLKI